MTVHIARKQVQQRTHTHAPGRVSTNVQYAMCIWAYMGVAKIVVPYAQPKNCLNQLLLKSTTPKTKQNKKNKFFQLISTSISLSVHLIIQCALLISHTPVLIANLFMFDPVFFPNTSCTETHMICLWWEEKGRRRANLSHP